MVRSGISASHHGGVWIVVVEPWFDGSHRAWAEGYAAHSAHDVDLVTHEGRFWRWRMQGSSLTLARDLERLVDERRRRPDVVIVSEMVDIAAFRGLARQALGGAPVVAYFHENQLTYPLDRDARPDLSPALTNWISLAAADEVWCNSEFHRTELARALPPLLGALPDHRHDHLVDEVLSSVRVEPVGLDVRPLAERPSDGRAPLVLWNHRWEHDKDPARFFAAIDRAADRGMRFRLAVTGQNFRRRPVDFDAAAARHDGRVVQWGELPRAEYEALLDEADVVVSTARHDFFGLAVAEAVAAGAAPVLPRDLAYPELVGANALDVLYADDDALDALLDRFLLDDDHRRRVARECSATVRERLAWPVVAGRYDRRLEEIVEAALSS